ncbi:MAG: transglycosylase domain-containing protein [Erysipelotrichaceae bacterium]|nr:transglycosylase domain-containing protein [Erysipelotrichaceae bacterium]
MIKKIKKLLFKLILLVFILLAGMVGYSYLECRDLLNEKPVLSMVQPYWSKEGYVPFDDLNKDFVNAVVATEDKRFFERKGFDFIAFTRAMLTNLYYQGLYEGGSTIPQQVAKNLYFSQDISIIRKIEEIFVMYELESKLTKEEILALYVNMNYYGDGYWGVNEASKGYYGIDQSEMSLAQAAMLAGLPQAPAVYQFSTGFEKAKLRQEDVLQAMTRNDYISEQQEKEALMEVLY